MDLAAGRGVVSWREAAQDPPDTQVKPLLKPAGEGPPIGPVTPLNPDSRSQAFIMGGTGPSGAVYRGCYNSRSTVYVRDIFGRPPGRNNVYTLSASPNIRWQKVTNAMRCAGCHNGSFRGTLNSKLSLSELDFKVLVDQSMPQGAHQDPLDQGSATAAVRDDLSADERIALANCLRAEFSLEEQRLDQWLTQSICR